MLLCLLFAFLSLPALAQGTGDQPLDLTDFSGGLNTYLSPLLIKPNEAQTATNVIMDHTGSLERRQGYTQVNGTAIGQGGTPSDVNAVYRLEQSNGNNYCVAFSSTSGYYSSDGCQTFALFVSTLTRGNDVNCDQYSDALYCVNNQYNFYWNGTLSVNGSIANANMPANMKYIRVHRNRCFAAGGSTFPSRLYFSALGDCTSWNTNTDYIDVATNAGDVITGIGPPYFDMLTIYKKYSTWALKGVDNNSFVLVNIRPDIGGKNHRAIANMGPYQLFDSLGPNGGQPGIYAFDGVQIQEISKNLRNDIDLIDSFRQATDRKTIDSQADWNLGTFDPKALSSTRQSGFMQSSYTATLDILGSDFAAGQTNGATLQINNIYFSTAIFPGSFSFSISTFQFVNGDFRYGNLNNWTANGSWSIVNAGIILSPCGRTGNLSGNVNAGNVDTDTANGFYALDSASDSSLTQTSILSQLDANGNFIKSCNIVYTNSPSQGYVYSSDTCDYRLVAGMSQPKFGLLTNPSIYPISEMRFQDNLGNSLTSIATFTANAIVVGLSPVINANNLIQQGFTTCGDRDFVQFSTFTSRVFDVAISSPIWGQFSSTFTTNSDVAINFQTQVATSASGVWDSSAAIQDTFRVLSSSKEYIRYNVIATHVKTSGVYYATSTFVINAVAMAAESTGTWRSNELFLSNNISAGGWGLFQTAQTVNGSQASIAYDIRVGTATGLAASAGPVVVTPGSVINTSTGAYVIVTATITVATGTDTAKIDNIVINWNEGTSATSASAVVFQNRYHYGAQSQNGTQNDKIYVLDTNGAWVEWNDVSPRMLSVINQQLMMAGSSTTGGGFIYQLYNSDSDSGNGFLSQWRSKDFDMGSMLHMKAVDAFYTETQSNNGNLTVDIYGDTGASDQQFSVPMFAGSQSYSVKYFPMATTSNARTFSVGFSNNSASAPWRLHKAGILWRDLGFIQP